MILAAEDPPRFAAGMDEATFPNSDRHQSAVIRELEVLPPKCWPGCVPLVREFHRAPPSSPLTNSALLRLRQIGRRARSTMLVSASMRPSSRNRTRPLRWFSA
jgi:hypothetical protein